MQINDFPVKLLINFALPVLILFFFSVFYTDHYKPSLFQGDELTYLKFAKEINENNFHFFERLGFSISVSLPVPVKASDHLLKSSFLSNGIPISCEITEIGSGIVNS